MFKHMHTGRHLQHDLLLNRPLSEPGTWLSGEGGEGDKDFTAEETLKESWADLT